MIRGWKNRVVSIVSMTMMFGALAALGGCESKGPAEKAGEQIDQGLQNAKDAVNPPALAKRPAGPSTRRSSRERLG